MIDRPVLQNSQLRRLWRVFLFQPQPWHGWNGDGVVTGRLAHFQLTLPAPAISKVLRKSEIHEEAR